MNLAFANLGSFAVPLMSGDAGIEQTINLMRQLVDEAKRDARINRQAIEIAKGAPAYDDAAKARAIYDWVLHSIHFINDPVDKELLRRPVDTIAVGAGDCDDITTLMCALLESIGLRCRIVTVAVDPASPGDFSHVYPEVNVNGQWIPVDAARQTAQFGMAPTNYFRKRVWDLSSKSFQDLSGVRARQRTLRGCHCGGKCKKLSGLGDDAGIIAAIGQGVASVARAADTSNPYASFATAYTPVSLPAGYTGLNTSALSTTSSSSLMLLAFAGLAVFLVMR